MPAPNELPEAVIERVIAAMRKGPQKLWRCDLVSDQISVERMTEIVTFALRAAGEGREGDTRWWANGPQGSFFGSDEVLIESLIRAGIAHLGWDDDWTMTDMEDHDDAR